MSDQPPPLPLKAQNNEIQRAPSTPTPSTPSFYDIRRSFSEASIKDWKSHTKKMIWRASTEEDSRWKRKPKDLETLLIHAFRGGLRAFILAHSIRSCFNVFLLLTRLLSRPRFLRKITVKSFVLATVLSKTSLKFGSVLGGFVATYRLVLHGLRLANGKEEYWHAGVAGFLGGLSVVFEEKSRRIGYGQQMFVRGLQAVFNSFTSRGYINIPHGDILLFAFGVGVIMYNWMVHYDLLDKGYASWITNAGRIPKEGVAIQNEVWKGGQWDLQHAFSLLKKSTTTQENIKKITEKVEQTKQGIWGPPFADCTVVHPFNDSCIQTSILKYFEVFKWIAPVYLGIHFAPPLLLRPKKYLRTPKASILRSLRGTFFSSSFLAFFVVIFQTLYCIRNNLYLLPLPPFFKKLITHRYIYFLIGASTSASLLLEEKKRRGELGMYVLPKALEGVWRGVLGKREVVKGGEVWLAGIGMAMVMSSYRHEPTMLSSLVRNILYQFVGMN